MNALQAYPIDKGNFYTDLDESTGLYCVFGTESGFAYASYADECEAEQMRERMSASHSE